MTDAASLDAAAEDIGARYAAQSTVDAAAEQKVFDKAAAATAPPDATASLKAALGELGPEGLTSVIVRSLAVVAGVLSPKLKFSEPEIAQLVQIWTPVAVKYMPDVAVSVEVAALAGTAIIVAPKFLPEGGFASLISGGGETKQEPPAPPTAAAS